MKKIIILIATFIIVFIAAKLLLDRSRTTSQVTSIVKEMVKLNRLETALVISENIVEVKESSGSVWRDMLFGDKLILVARGEVIAGIDFSQMKSTDVLLQKNQIIVMLPPPQILISRIDNAQTRVFDRRTGILTRGNMNLEAEARTKAEEAIRRSACEAGVLDMANTNAEKQLLALLSAISDKPIIIQTQKNTCQF